MHLSSSVCLLLHVSSSFSQSMQARICAMSAPARKYLSAFDNCTPDMYSTATWNRVARTIYLAHRHVMSLWCLLHHLMPIQISWQLAQKLFCESHAQRALTVLTYFCFFAFKKPFSIDASHGCGLKSLWHWLLLLRASRTTCSIGKAESLL